MNSGRNKIIFNGGVILLMMGLFIMVFLLNWNQHTRSTSIVETIYKQSLDQQAKARLMNISAQKNKQLQLIKKDSMLEEDLSITGEKQFTGIIPDSFVSIPPHVIARSKANIRKQYVTGNIILSLMLLLSIGFTAGLIAASSRQRDLDAMQTKFITAISHELRTPLSLIRLHAETLHRCRLPINRMADYHQTILTETERLTHVINNMLDFSRIKVGEIQLHPESTNLSVLCKHITESFHSRFEMSADYRLINR